jgi:hypothetical protein
MSQPEAFSPYDMDKIFTALKLEQKLQGVQMTAVYRDNEMVDLFERPKRVNFEGAAIASVMIPEGMKLVIFMPTNDTHKMAAEFMDSEIFACIKDANGEFEPTVTRILTDMVYERGSNVMILTLESIA